MKALYTLIAVALSWGLSANAQNYFRMTDGKKYCGKIKKETADVFMVEIESENRIISLPKENIVLAEFEETGLEIYKPEYIHRVQSNITKASELFETGHHVYVPIAGTKIAQRYGSCKLRELLSSDPHWIAVDTPDEAHVIIRYVFDDSGRDHAYLKILNQNESSVLHTSQSVSATDWSPWDAGEDSAKKLFRKLMFSVKKRKF